MQANRTTSRLPGLGARVTGFGYERHTVFTLASPARESAIYASRRSGVPKNLLLAYVI